MIKIKIIKMWKMKIYNNSIKMRILNNKKIINNNKVLKRIKKKRQRIKDNRIMKQLKMNKLNLKTIKKLIIINQNLNKINSKILNSKMM